MCYAATIFALDVRNYTRVLQSRLFCNADSLGTFIKNVGVHTMANPGNYELWDKGPEVGNLRILVIAHHLSPQQFGIIRLGILARILSHIQNKIEPLGPIEGTEEMRALYQSLIQGHPTITHFDTVVSFENTTTLYSALSTADLECSVVRQQRPGRRKVSFPIPGEHD
jgi:hypothetical protein